MNLYNCPRKPFSKIGEKTVQDLIRTFKSVKRVKEQSEESLASVVGKAKAKVIKQFFGSN